MSLSDFMRRMRASFRKQRELEGSVRGALAGMLRRVVERAKKTLAVEPVTLPIRRSDKQFERFHGEYLDGRARAAKILFLGDSLMHGWRSVRSAKHLFEEQLASLGVVVLSVPGDAIQHLLWRLGEGGELNGAAPSDVVVLIGTNNIPTHGAAEIVDGIERTLDAIARAVPEARQILLTIPPRNGPSSKERKKVALVNAGLRKLSAPCIVVDPWQGFVDEKENLRPNIYADEIHFTPAAYEILARRLIVSLKRP